MAGNYILTFSSPFKTETVVVPSASGGSGVNDYDTSLVLAGPGYVNYGIAYAQNFLKLLENFASPYPPDNAIQGQLWYDTSDSNKKVLRVNDGTDTSSRWAPASGIYQQPNDPAEQYQDVIYDGDIWVDTNNAQLKIRYGTTWKVVGPDSSSGADKSGSEFTYLESTTGQFYPVILNWANNKVITITSNNDFIPRVVIDGFTNVKVGVNLTNKNQAKYYGVAEKAEALIVSANSTIRASDLLKNRTSTSQVHTGSLKISSSEGLSILNPDYNHEIRIKSNNADGASLNFNSPDQTKKFKVGINDYSFITFNPKVSSIGINTATTDNSPPLDVFGNTNITGKVTIYESILTALDVQGKTNLSKDVTINENLRVNGITTSTGKLVVGTSTGTAGIIIEPGKNDVYDIGTPTSKFRTIYASSVGTPTSTVVFYGNLNGTATKLATKREIRLKGHVTGTAVLFDGSANIEFTTTITSYVFTQSVSTSSATAFHSLLVCNTSLTTSSVQVISKQNFLNDVTVGLVLPGTIIPFAGNTSTVESILKPDGKPAWLLCNNSGTPGVPRFHTQTYFTALYDAVQTKYHPSPPPGFFAVPDMTTATTIYSGPAALYYIIKT